MILIPAKKSAAEPLVQTTAFFDGEGSQAKDTVGLPPHHPDDEKGRERVSSRVVRVVVRGSIYHEVQIFSTRHMESRVLHSSCTGRIDRVQITILPTVRRPPLRVWRDLLILLVDGDERLSSRFTLSTRSSNFNDFMVGLSMARAMKECPLPLIVFWAVSLDARICVCYNTTHLQSGTVEPSHRRACYISRPCWKRPARLRSAGISTTTVCADVTTARGLRSRCLPEMTLWPHPHHRLHSQLAGVAMRA